MDWKFSDPRNTAVFTTWPILRGEDWIASVTHDAEDGAWQFLGASGATGVSAAAIIGLDEIAELDRSIVELADLPLGWRAWRESKGAAWHRAKTM